MKILGIDPGIQVCGYGLLKIDGQNPTLIEAGVIKTTSSKPLYLRLAQIYDGFCGLIRSQRPDCVAVEKIFSHYKHPATSYMLAHARGVVCLACAKEAVELFEYPSTHIKKALTGKGMASKEQVLRMIMNILSINSRPEYFDITDALAVAITHSHTLKTK